jgi:hypothetical protein
MTRILFDVVYVLIRRENVMVAGRICGRVVLPVLRQPRAKRWPRMSNGNGGRVLNHATTKKTIDATVFPSF